MSEPRRIFLSPPHMGGRELDFIHEAFASNYIAPTGAMIDGFEREFSEMCGIPHCVALSSGTAAIHLALRGLGVSAGDVVYASSLTFIGSITPILFQNATPVLIDSDRASWTMDVGLLEQTLHAAKKQNALPKAIIPTDLYGQSCNAAAIRALGDEYGVPVIIDAAEAVGASYQGKHAGYHAAAAAFSFNGNKVITTSGGGMLASHNKKLIDEARFLSQQARDAAPHYEHSTYGYNYRMSNIVAAIGRGQLEVLSARVARRREIFTYYETQLAGVAGIGFMPEAGYGQGNRWLSVITVDAAAFGCDREALRVIFERENVETRPVWKPMHMQPVFKDVRMVGGAVSAEFFRDGLCLPSGSQMSEADLARVVGIIRSAARP